MKTESNNLAAQASDEQAVLSKQVAAWRVEVARLNDLIAHASGVQASDEPMRDAFELWALTEGWTTYEIAATRTAEGYTLTTLQQVWRVWQAAAGSAQAVDEPMQAVITLAWKWHDAAVKAGFASSEPAQELFELLEWPYRFAAPQPSENTGELAPRATADVELREAVGKLIKAKGRFHTEQNYAAVVRAYDAATKPGETDE